MKFQNPPLTSNGPGQINDCLSLISQNRKNDTFLFCLKNIILMAKLQKKIFEIIVQTALFVGGF